MGFPVKPPLGFLPHSLLLQGCPYLHLPEREDSCGTGSHQTVRWKLTAGASSWVFTIYQRKCKNKQCRDFNYSARRGLSNTQNVNYIRHSQHGQQRHSQPCLVSSPSGKPPPLSPASVSRASTRKCGNEDTGLPPESRVGCMGKQGALMGRWGGRERLS